MRMAIQAAVVAVTAMVTSTALAQNESAYQKVAVQKRKYVLANELKLSVGVLPLDPYEKGYSASLSFTRHFNQYWAWEIVSASAALLDDTDLKDQLVDVFGQSPDNFAAPRLVFTTGVELTPFYGKWAFLNDGIVRHSFLVGGYAGVIFGDREEFSGGDGPTTLGDVRPSVGPGLGYRVFLSQNWSARLDWRTLLSFRFEQVPEEGDDLDVVMLINLSLSWNFGADV